MYLSQGPENEACCGPEHAIPRQQDVAATVCVKSAPQAAIQATKNMIVDTTQ